MEKLVSKWCLDCGTCPWGHYPRKSMTAREFELYRDKAMEVLGCIPIRNPCVTCQIPDDEIPQVSKLPNCRCLIRQ